MKNPITLDCTLIFSVIAITALGLLMVTSSSMPLAVRQYDSSFYFLWKQAVFAVLGWIALFTLLYVPTSFYQRYVKVWVICAFVALVLVLIPHVGHEVNGSKRWIILGPIALQVSEFVKLCAVLVMAEYLTRYAGAVRTTTQGVLMPIGVLGMVGLLLLLEPDFGATVVLFLTCLGMMFMAGVRLRWFLLFGVLGAGAVTLLILWSPYRMARLMGFLHPWESQRDAGYQLTQSLIAVGRGGWFGVGLGNSIQKLFYLPEAHTDFVLAIFAEEVGFIGVLILLGLFCLMVYRGLKIAFSAQALGRSFPAYIAYGVTFWLGLQVIVNVGVNIGLLPTKGLTLPFMSYGGSSLVIDTVAIALLLRVDLESKWAALA